MVHEPARYRDPEHDGGQRWQPEDRGFRAVSVGTAILSIDS